MRLWLCMSVAAVAAVAVTGAAGGETTAAGATKPTVAVVVVGSGRVTSRPAGISCPGKCSATFAAGSSVLLTPKAKTGSRFLRWGGDCTGAGACKVRVSALAAVAAQFVGPTNQPPPPPQNSAVEPGGYSGSGSSPTFRPGWRPERAELRDPGQLPRSQLCWRRFVLHLLQDPGGDDQAGSLLHRQDHSERGGRRGQSDDHLLCHRAFPGEVCDRSGDCDRRVPRKHRLRRYAQSQVHFE